MSLKVITERRRGFLYNLSKHRTLYIMFLPVIVTLFLFNYAPMWGLLFSVFDYKPVTGANIFQNKFVGLLYFKTLLTMPEFPRLIFNTVIINVYRIVFGTPAPVILALMINEVRNKAYKRTVQTFSYLPHFISWIIVAGIMQTLINQQFGIVNNFLREIDVIPPKWYSRPEFWRSILVGTGIWKNVGFDSILYLAAIASIDPELYEAAVIDGASRFKQHWYITLPSLIPTVVILFILGIGKLMSGDFGQIYALVGNSTPLYKTVDVLDVYIYREGIRSAQYSFGTALGIFQSAIGLILVYLTNKASKAIGEVGIW